MAGKLAILVFLTVIAFSQGEPQTSYDRNREKVPGGFGNGYYPDRYPDRYPNGYYPGQQGYPHPGLIGPPGAHPGCPLCDSSVYSYCSYKQAHDACCCENSGYMPFHCRNTNCNFVYANSCDEYQLITNCCCVDVQRSAINNVVV